MSSTSRLLLAIAWLGCAPLAAFQKPSGEAVTCPAAIDVNEVLSSPSGWTALPARVSHKFERISVYNADAAGKEYDLAPDDQTTEAGKTVQTWTLAAYRTMSLFVRCRYHDTGAVLQKQLPLKIGKCTLRIAVNENGVIAGVSEMECK
jgi:hypothetical protein